MIEVQASFLVLQTVTEMQNDIGMTSEINIVYFWFISLFGNHFTKIQYKFDENASVSRKMSPNILKTIILTVWPFLLLLPYRATVYKFEFCY